MDMSVLAIITAAIIVINFIWTRVSHSGSAGEIAPIWIDRVTHVPWLVANIIWWLFAGVVVYIAAHFYFSNEIFFAVAGLLVLGYSFAHRTPKAYRNILSAALNKLTFIPVWAMAVIGLTDPTLVYFSLFFAAWSVVSSVLQGRYMYLTRVLSGAYEEAMAEKEAEAGVVAA